LASANGENRGDLAFSTHPQRESGMAWACFAVHPCKAAIRSLRQHLSGGPVALPWRKADFPGAFTQNRRETRAIT
jgi:hypothetical protein